MFRVCEEKYAAIRLQVLRYGREKNSDSGKGKKALVVVRFHWTLFGAEITPLSCA